ncbi:DUF1330 domain-containing protein [uncultured Roseobacter sp.]|uniref:DUF1330 domain-containing protein n=1 Tax=uncultured Roseobacter sp. TaxID=114847 RepID=UPI00262C3DBE|nr:DUF1330 domain-containing protein [uncultured Roseobacter sp.]
MTAHAVATLKLKDPEALAAYREKAGAALARHGGAVLQASTELTRLEGAQSLPDGVAILTFPDRDAAQAWIDDPELAETHALRTRGAETLIALL